MKKFDLQAWMNGEIALTKCGARMRYLGELRNTDGTTAVIVAATPMIEGAAEFAIFYKPADEEGEKPVAPETKFILVGMAPRQRNGFIAISDGSVTYGGKIWATEGDLEEYNAGYGPFTIVPISWEE